VSWRRRTVALLALHGLSGCWWSRTGDVGVSIAPSVKEAYEVRVLVRGGDFVGAPVAQAHVRLCRDNHCLGEELTNAQGLAVIRAPPEGTSDAPGGVGPEPLRLDPEGRWLGGNGVVVEHNYGAVQRHPHWKGELRIEAPGFEPARRDVELPRPVDSAPVTVALSPHR
jgi:hypothetical protein